MNKQEANILKDRAGAIYGAVDHAKSIGDIDHRLAKDILEFTRLVKEYTEKPLLTHEQAWNKIAEAYPGTAQSLRITLDHAVFGHMDKERKIPKIIAKYLELCKTDNFDFTEDYNLIAYDFINYFDTDLTIEEMEEIKMWFYDNDQKENQRRHILFLQAYAYGYEVEEEPQWTIKIGSEHLTGLQFIKNGKKSDVQFFTNGQKKMYFSDESKAEAVALLVDGSVEEV